MGKALDKYLGKLITNTRKKFLFKNTYIAFFDPVKKAQIGYKFKECSLNLKSNDRLNLR